MLTSCLATLFITLLSIFAYFYKRFYFSYWERKKIPNLQQHVPRTKPHLGIQLQQLYKIMKEKKWKHGGFYQQLSPVYVICDLNYVKNIMTRDFNYFPYRGLYYNETSDPLSAHIFNTSGAKWKRMRRKLDQIFTSSKLKTIFPLLPNCGEKLAGKCEPVDIKKVLDDFISDVIELCVFGSECKVFKQLGRKILNRSRLRRLKGIIINNFPKLAKILDIVLIPRDASTFFKKVVAEIVEERKKGQTGRNDFLQVLVEMEKKFEITIDEIAAQCFIFLIAGMSTSPTAMTFALYELARHQDIQEKVRQDIAKFGKVTYDSLQEMKYLGQVFDETLRMYPPAAYLNRKCERNYEIPDGSGIIVEKGTIVAIPVLGIHYDRDYYPDPEKFDPEHFSEENKRLRPNFAFLPFGEGPRICIGMRFGLMQSKLGLVSLLKRYKFTVSEKTREPLKMKPNSLVLSAEGEIWLDVTEIKI
ncbi:probable cytochrome P450 6a17 isoform X2 [Tribolium castaneum]|nr:PREDICTED: probable cytochrome P450 6a17 isoform X2 [Tribolium castaneum]|eukprot:XP_968293.3 PREDICTED: probable cytochrome P450 6a17 isoform X2 [Tribolium castaneum]